MNTYSVGGTISGLNAAGLTLANGSDTVAPASGATAFTLPTKLATGVAYSVTISTQPTAETCTVSSGSGNVAAANVTNVKVTCAAVVAATWHTAHIGPGEGQRAVLASDPSDSAFFVAWPQTGLAPPSAPNAISASHFTDASGWSTPAAIAPGTDTSAVAGLGFDNQGKGYALISYDSQTAESSRYAPASGWTPEPLAVPEASPPVVYPPNTTLFTQTVPVGLAVFGDGAATGLVLTQISATTVNMAPSEDLPYRRVNAGPPSDLLSYGPADGSLPQSSSAAVPYQYTANGVDFTTRYYFPTAVFLPHDAMVHAPTAHNYAAYYRETDFTGDGGDAQGNLIFIMTLSQGLVLWINDVPHPAAISSEVSRSGRDAASADLLIGGGIAVSDNGTALVAWSALSGDNSTLNFYALRFDGTAWIGPQLLSTLSGPNVPSAASRVAAAVNANGDGIIFFATNPTTGSAVGAMMAVRVDGTTGAYGAPVQVSTAPYFPAPTQALLDAQGNAYVMETRGVFRLAAGGSSYEANGLSCACDNNTGGQMKLDRDGFPMVTWGAADGLWAGRYH
jgi:hypothetical protein